MMQSPKTGSTINNNNNTVEAAAGQVRSAALLLLLCMAYACFVQYSLVSDILHGVGEKRAATLFRSSPRMIIMTRKKAGADVLGNNNTTSTSTTTTTTTMTTTNSGGGGSGNIIQLQFKSESLGRRQETRSQPIMRPASI